VGPSLSAAAAATRAWTTAAPSTTTTTTSTSAQLLARDVRRRVTDSRRRRLRRLAPVRTTLRRPLVPLAVGGVDRPAAGRRRRLTAAAAAGERGLGEPAPVRVGDLDVDAVDVQPVAEARRREAGRPADDVAVQLVVDDVRVESAGVVAGGDGGAEQQVADDAVVVARQVVDVHADGVVERCRTLRRVHQRQTHAGVRPAAVQTPSTATRRGRPAGWRRRRAGGGVRRRPRLRGGGGVVEVGGERRPWQSGHAAGDGRRRHVTPRTRHRAPVRRDVASQTRRQVGMVTRLQQQRAALPVDARRPSTRRRMAVCWTAEQLAAGCRVRLLVLLLAAMIRLHHHLHMHVCSVFTQRVTGLINLRENVTDWAHSMGP